MGFQPHIGLDRAAHNFGEIENLALPGYTHDKSASIYIIDSHDDKQ